MPYFRRRVPYKITWRSRQVFDHVKEATIAALNETMQACVIEAKANAPVKTHALQDDINYTPAYEVGRRIVGRWGNYDVPYAFYQEKGTIYIEAKHYLQRAADSQYPLINGRIAKHVG